jgi:hypothetical protein
MVSPSFYNIDAEVCPCPRLPGSTSAATTRRRFPAMRSVPLPVRALKRERRHSDPHDSRNRFRSGRFCPSNGPPLAAAPQRARPRARPPRPPRPPAAGARGGGRAGGGGLLAGAGGEPRRPDRALQGQGGPQARRLRGPVTPPPRAAHALAACSPWRAATLRGPRPLSRRGGRRTPTPTPPMRRQVSARAASLRRPARRFPVGRRRI